MRLALNFVMLKNPCDSPGGLRCPVDKFQRLVVIERTQKIEMTQQRGRSVCGDGIFFHQVKDDGQGIIIDIKRLTIHAKTIAAPRRWSERWDECEFHIGGFDQTGACLQRFCEGCHAQRIVAFAEMCRIFAGGVGEKRRQPFLKRGCVQRLAEMIAQRRNGINGDGEARAVCAQPFATIAVIKCLVVGEMLAIGTIKFGQFRAEEPHRKGQRVVKRGALVGEMGRDIEDVT